MLYSTIIRLPETFVLPVSFLQSVSVNTQSSLGFGFSLLFPHLTRANLADCTVLGEVGTKWSKASVAMDGDREPTGMYLRRLCVALYQPPVSKPATSASIAQCKILFRHVHQVVRAGQHGCHMRTGAWQDAGKVEAGGLQLGLVESLFAGTGSQFFGSDPCHVGPEVGQAGVAGVHAVIHGSGTYFFTILHGGHADLHGQLAPFLVDLGQRCDKFLDGFVLFVGLAELVYHLGEGF